MATQKRTTKGRFKSDATRDLYEIVRVVAKLGTRAGADPRRITQEAWNAARALSAWPDAPRADEICRQTKRSWRELLEDVISSKNLEASDRARTRALPDPLLDDERIYFALHRVLLFSGKLTLSADDYSLGRRELIEYQRRRWKKGGDPEALLPTRHQIVEACDGNWNLALEIAELPPVEPARATQSRVPIAEVATQFVEETGEWPTERELRDYARDKGFELTKSRAQKFSEAIAAAHKTLTDASKQVPELQPYRPSKRQLTWSKTADVVATSSGPTAVTAVRIVRSLREFAAECENRTPKAKPTLAFYRELQRTEKFNHWPAPSGLNTRGSFPAMLADAQREDALEEAMAKDAATLAEKTAAAEAAKAIAAAKPPTPTKHKGMSPQDPRAIKLKEFLKDLGEPAGNKAIRSALGFSGEWRRRSLLPARSAGAAAGRPGSTSGSTPRPTPNHPRPTAKQQLAIADAACAAR